MPVVLSFSLRESHANVGSKRQGINYLLALQCSVNTVKIYWPVLETNILYLSHLHCTTCITVFGCVCLSPLGGKKQQYLGKLGGKLGGTGEL